MPRPSVLVLQHVACETLGTIEDALVRAGLAHRYVRIHEGEPVPTDVGDAAALVVMGGPMSVYEHDRLAHLKAEMRLVESALKSERPVLGVCLGSQLLAHVLLAKVYPGARKEIGWHDVSLTPAAEDDPVWSAAPARFAAFHWHGDVFDLPRSAVSLARSELTDCQAFRYGKNVYGILFHMEVTQPQVGTMTEVFADEVRQVGATAEKILADTDRHLPRLAEIGRGIYDGWTRLATG
ncbi:MAG TPA: type 1 glutamine amidotransferase [Pirellulales bacterium]|jgi:GMP synthase (glutamine-hydrolysing)|nr:type 1 glutamine amidotransferase [Pirellulales bacterium]